MRKGRTHWARALGRRSTGRRGMHRWRAQAPAIALCALGVGILTATAYGLMQRPATEASTGIGITTAIKDKAARKDDQLITGSLPTKKQETAPAADAKATPQAAKKKPATATAKTETQKNFLDFFNNAPQKR